MAMLPAVFILFTIVLFGCLYTGLWNIAGRAYADAREQKIFRIKAGILLAGWIAYVSILSLNGLFTVASFPPRIPLLLIIPACLFFIYFIASGRFKKIIIATPPGWPVYFQSFRIVVELLIFYMYRNGIVPRVATFEGYNFEVIIGISALPVAWFVFTRCKLSRAIAVIWNIAGLCTLAIVVYILSSYCYFPNKWGEQVSILDKGFGNFPYTFLPGLYVPLALFMHIFSFLRMRMDSTNSAASGSN